MTINLKQKGKMSSLETDSYGISGPFLVGVVQGLHWKQQEKYLYSLSKLSVKHF